VASKRQAEGAELARVTADAIAAYSWDQLDAYGKRVEDVITPSGRRFQVTSLVFWDMEPWESMIYVFVKAAPERGWRRFWPYKEVRTRGGPDDLDDDPTRERRRA
jgi:hypothetical protein